MYLKYQAWLYSLFLCICAFIMMVQMTIQLPVFFYLFLSDSTKLQNNRLPAAVMMCHPPIQAHGSPPRIRIHTPICFEPETSSVPQGNRVKLCLCPFSQAQNKKIKKKNKNETSTETKILCGATIHL